MITELINIRAKQLSRMTKDLGIFWSLFFVVLFGGIGWIVVLQLLETPNKFVIVALFLLAILALQLKRKDRGFVRLIADFPPKVFWVEYLILSIPLLVILLVLGEWLMMLLVPIILLGISFVHFSTNHRALNNFLIEWIPSEAFEWKAGVRKYFYLLVILQFIGLLGFYYVGPIPVVVYFLGVFIIGFYQECESELLLMVGERNPNQFLLRKIFLGLGLFALMISPMVVLFLLFHPGYWYIPLLLFLLIGSVLVYVILLKYAFFEANTIKSSNVFWAIWGIGALFLPPFLPVVWVLSIYFYFKATNKLKPYLYAFN